MLQSTSRCTTLLLQAEAHAIGLLMRPGAKQPVGLMGLCEELLCGHALPRWQPSTILLAALSCGKKSKAATQAAHSKSCRTPSLPGLGQDVGFIAQ